jgi:hypothetical protein
VPTIRAAAGVAGDVLHVGTVDLDDVGREPVQVAQRGVAGAEVVDRDAYAGGPQLPQRADHLGLVGQRVLGDLEHHLLRPQAGRGQRRGDPGREVGSSICSGETLTDR